MGLFYIPTWSTLNISAFFFGSIISLCALSSYKSPYSKFGSRVKLDTIPSRQAMLALYFPSFLVCLFFQWPVLSLNRFDLIHLLTTFHFFKRLFEVIFVHIYKSKTNPSTTFIIMSTYTLTTLLDLKVARNLPVSNYSKLWALAGTSCYFVGELMNGYHHYLLRRLRVPKSADYRLPRGGLFKWMVAPHYQFEQLSYLGLLLISQNIVSLSLKFFPFIYLTFRARQTKIWYKEHLEAEKDRKEVENKAYMIPFLL
ncbi:3-oxo-5-alpha-steroid 4-dehydrogenase-domain-containing protein [Sporodiniella umbellata]|nr:3-oxo-5-alpha-steroid 4-dehydrogenase-domain-containing protein [Sporodiniella umbellata]